MYRHMARFEALERADGATRRVPAIVTPLFLSRAAARKLIVLDKELRYIFRKNGRARARAIFQDARQNPWESDVRLGRPSLPRLPNGSESFGILTGDTRARVRKL